MITIVRSAVQPNIDPANKPPTLASEDRQDVGTSFSGLLAALVTPCNGLGGFLEDKPGIAPTDPATAGQAKVFNANGLFYGVTLAAFAIPGPERQAADILLPMAVERVPLPVDVSGVGAEVLIGKPVRVASPNLSVERMQSIEARQTSTFPHDVVSSHPGSVVPPSTRLASAMQVVSIFEPEPFPAESRVGRPARLVRLLDERAATTSVGATLHATDGGQTVTAHAGTVDRQDRVKLRDRIVALLSRHGLVARGVRIDGTDTASYAKRGR